MNDLYWFNPDNEMSIANGNANYTLPANIAAMAADLSFLPAYLAGEGDHILLPHPVDPSFLRHFRDIFHRDIHPVLPTDLPTLSPCRVLPWGWSPRAHRVLQPAIRNASPAFRQSPAAQRFHNHNGNAVFCNDFVLFGRTIKLPIQIVDLQQRDIPFVRCRTAFQNFGRIVDRKTDFLYFAFRLFLFQKVVQFPFFGFLERIGVQSVQ